jgi:hypothetical protein
LALDGTALTIDDGANAAFYKKPGVLASDINTGAVKSGDDSAKRFMAAISTSTQRPTPVPPTASATTPAVPSEGTPRTDAPVPSHSTSAQTFPMEDPAPGGQPK